VGPEVVARALGRLPPRTRAVVFGDPEALARAARVAGVSLPRAVTGGLEVLEGDDLALRVVAPPLAGVPWVAGHPDERADQLAARALEDALDAARRGLVDAVATGPARKRCFSLVRGGPFPGHTELFHAELGVSPAPVMLFITPGLKLALHTIHLPLAKVPGAVTPEALMQTLQTLHRGLQQDLGIRAPRVDVLGLNPHAGEDGLLGQEEGEVVAPVLEEARAAGVDVHGPFPADGYFARLSSRVPHPDAVLAMYHDQGLGPFKLLDRGRGCQTTLVLAVPRTSCDHGTAYDVAGRGRADGRSMTAAIRLAATVARRRRGAGGVAGPGRLTGGPASR
jgi:4-hydroxythreonine-4-phosphate dehydrogenase